MRQISTSNMKFIFLLLFITAASPSPFQSFENFGNVKIGYDLSSTAETTTGSGLTDDTDSITETQRNDQEGSKGYWDCQEGEVMRDELVRTTGMLQEGETASSRQEASAVETILVLGKPGTGKTTLVQFLSGDNSKLISNEVGSGSGEFVIEDGLKIGGSATQSFTLYPDVVSYNSTVAFCDTPGFRDTRSPSHEIVASSVLKKTVAKFQNVKILLLCNYNSLQYGVDKDSLTDLLSHVTRFITDIGKYKDNTALIATKVPFTYAIKNGNPTPVSDTNIIKNIANFLCRVKGEYESEMNKTAATNKKRFYESAIELLTSLVKSDSEGNFSRINLFRRPIESGPLMNSSAAQENKRSLITTIFNNLEAVETNAHDFDYSLSDRAKIYLDCLLKYVNENVVNTSNQIYRSMKKHYISKISRHNSIHSLVTYLKKLNSDMASLDRRLEGEENYNDYLRKLKDYAGSRNITLDDFRNNTTIDLNVYVDSLGKFVDTKTVFTPATWSAPMKHVLQYIEDTSHWYQFLMNVFESLSSFQVQNNRDIIYKDEYRNSSNSVNFFITNSKVLKEQIDFDRFQELRLNEERIEELRDVISMTVAARPNITCDVEGRYVMSGHFVKASDMYSEDKVRLYCGDRTIKQVAILAASKVFIDMDIKADRFRGVDMFIAAPTWEVVGRRDIVLNGVDGKAILEDAYLNNERKRSCTNDGRRGLDGKPGLPGGNGGHFVGVGLNFINAASLSIKSNGGVGGPGVNGTDGCPGINAISGYDDFLSNHLTNADLVFNFHNGSQLKKSEGFSRHYPFRLSQNVKMSVENRVECHSLLDVYERYGKFGNRGGDGGNGGVGGFGGQPGKLELIHLKDSSEIGVEKSSGRVGLCGTGGKGATRGKDGIGMSCYRIEMKYNNNLMSKEYWNCVNTSSICQQADYYLRGSNGLSNSSQVGLLKPKATVPFHYSHFVLDYAILLESISGNKFFNKTVSEFKAALFQHYTSDMNTAWSSILTKLSILLR